MRLRHSAVLVLLLVAVPSIGLSQTEGAARIVVREGSSFTQEGSFGGSVPAGTLGQGCLGYIDNDPQFIIDVANAGWVRFDITAGDPDADTTLLLRGPSGTLCNDDAGEGTLNPQLSSYLNEGEYYLYVGGYAARDHGPFDLAVEHAGRTVAPTLRGNRAVQMMGVSGGPVTADELHGGCTGFIPGEPNHTILLSGRSLLHIGADSSSDLTLMVEGVDGFRCNDDSLGTLNPAVRSWFPEGPVRIFVGSHNPRVRAEYTVNVTPLEASE